MKLNTLGLEILFKDKNNGFSDLSPLLVSEEFHLKML